MLSLMLKQQGATEMYPDGHFLRDLKWVNPYAPAG